MTPVVKNERKEMENRVNEMAESMKYSNFERSVYLSKVKDIEKKHLEKEIRVESEKYKGMQAVLKRLDETPRRPIYRFHGFYNKIRLIRGLPRKDQSKPSLQNDIFEHLLAS